jgi:hypothetical protein
MNSRVFNVFRDCHAVDDSVGGHSVDVDFFCVDNELADHDRVILGRTNIFGSILWIIIWSHFK